MAVLALLAALAADAAPTLPDLIAQAAVGKAQCYSPDLARKVCRSLNSYTLQPDGQIANSTSVVIGRSPVVVITTVSRATVANGRVCTVMKKDDIQAATFTIDGDAPNDDQATQLRGAVLNSWAGVVGHMMCVSFVADGSQFIAHTALDGLPRPNLDQRMIWVAPKDGWRVAP